MLKWWFLPRDSSKLHFWGHSVPLATPLPQRGCPRPLELSLLPGASHTFSLQWLRLSLWSQGPAACGTCPPDTVYTPKAEPLPHTAEAEQVQGGGPVWHLPYFSLLLHHLELTQKEVSLPWNWGGMDYRPSICQELVVWLPAGHWPVICSLIQDHTLPIFQSTVNIQQYKSTLENARFCYYYYSNTVTNMWDFPGGLACNARHTEFRIPGSGRSPGEGNGNPFQYLAWKIPWTNKPGGLQSTGSQKSWTQLSDCASKPQRPVCGPPSPPEALSGAERKPPTHTHALKLSYRKVRAALSWLPGKPEILYFSPVCQHSHL